MTPSPSQDKELREKIEHIVFEAFAKTKPPVTRFPLGWATSQLLQLFKAEMEKCRYCGKDHNKYSPEVGK